MRNAALLLLLWCTPLTAATLESPRELRAPGGVAILDLGKRAAMPTATFREQRVAVVPCEENWCALVGLPLDLEPGDYRLAVESSGEKREIAFKVEPKQYEVQRLTVKQKKYVDPSPEELDRILREKEIILQAFSTWTERLPPRRFVLPVEGRLSSHFGLQRYFNGEPRAPHSGIDIAGPIGTPIKAPADGVVIETGNFFFNGNTVFIDHGRGLVTMYNHLHEIVVKKGQALRQGDVIGTVGRSGRVTGPHLHWSVSLNNSRVDPMLWLPPEAFAAAPNKR